MTNLYPVLVLYGSQACMSTIYYNEGEKSTCTIVINETVLN